jgi:hypothetical protein
LACSFCRTLPPKLEQNNEQSIQSEHQPGDDTINNDRRLCLAVRTKRREAGESDTKASINDADNDETPTDPQMDIATRRLAFCQLWEALKPTVSFVLEVWWLSLQRLRQISS